MRRRFLWTCAQVLGYLGGEEANVVLLFSAGRSGIVLLFHLKLLAKIIEYKCVCSQLSFPADRALGRS